MRAHHSAAAPALHSAAWPIATSGRAASRCPGGRAAVDRRRGLGGAGGELPHRPALLPPRAGATNDPDRDDRRDHRETLPDDRSVLDETGNRAI